MMKQVLTGIIIFFSIGLADAQMAKVHHAEPLYYDLVRDLGARKGEKELNIGADFRNVNHENEYVFLAEYEFAPVNRLGVEVETDFSVMQQNVNEKNEKKGELEAVRVSAQYSFFVSEKYATTLAVGYTQIAEKVDFKRNRGRLVKQMTFNPFFVAAKRWGKNWHSMIYTYPLFQKGLNKTETSWDINTSVHYALPHSRHMVGMEINEEFSHGKVESTLRPQVKLKLNNALALGVVSGFPVHSRQESFSSFFRVIYELN